VLYCISKFLIIFYSGSSSVVHSGALSVQEVSSKMRERWSKATSEYHGPNRWAWPVHREGTMQVKDLDWATAVLTWGRKGSSRYEDRRGQREVADGSEELDHEDTLEQDPICI